MEYIEQIRMVSLNQKLSDIDFQIEKLEKQKQNFRKDYTELVNKCDHKYHTGESSIIEKKNITRCCLCHKIWKGIEQ